jgi:hypothetical protein
MQLMRINQAAHVGILLTNRELYPQPVGLALGLAGRYYRQINHPTKIVKNVVKLLAAIIMTLF